MRAVRVHQFGPVDGLTVEEVPAPEPAAGEILIRTEAIGVNYADTLVIAGDYQLKPPLPFIPGKEAVGVVEALEGEESDFAVGDRVIAHVEFGAYAEQMSVTTGCCHLVPDELSPPEAVALGLTYQTAYFALQDRGALVAGERVLITGASGGVGLATLQLVKARGGVALVGARTDAQAAFVRAHGADHVIRLDDPDVHEQLREQVREATSGHGADVVIESVGGEIFDAALRAVAWRGRLVVVGFAGGTIPTVKAGYLLVKNISVIGLQWSDYRNREADWIRRAQGEIFELRAKGKIKPVIAGVFPLEGYSDALTAVHQGGVQGKLVLLPHDG